MVAVHVLSLLFPSCQILDLFSKFFLFFSPLAKSLIYSANWRNGTVAYQVAQGLKSTAGGVPDGGILKVQSSRMVGVRSIHSSVRLQALFLELIEEHICSEF